MEKRRNFIEIFNELLSERELTRKSFAVQSGIPYPTVIGWTNLGRLPDFFALIKIADFFGCSVDYLTGRQNEFGSLIESNVLSPSEEGLVGDYRSLSSENRTLVLKLIKSLMK